MRRFLRNLLLAIGIWCLGGVFALFFQTAGHTLSQENLRAWNAMLTGLDAQQIIINNLFVMTIALVGLFTAGTTAALTLLVNGFVAILFLKGFSILEFPWPVRYRFSYLFFEVCALWGSGAMGLQGFSQVFLLFTKPRRCFLYKEPALIIIVYVISIVLTIIAGLLEADVIRMLKTQR